MKRALVMLLLASSALADDPSRGRFWRFCSRTDQGRTHRGFQCDDLAFFEAFPASGAGTTTACSTTAPTGAKGEALTFTRGSTATCTKTATGGLTTTGIANGDLVVLSSNVARVEYDSAGTLGLLVEASRTNSCLRSQELNNAVWTAGGTFAPTVTADFAVAPDGTTTAERVQFSATTAAQSSYVAQIGPTSGIGSTFSGYVKGNGTSGTIDVCTETTAALYCVSCAYVSTSWKRCVTLPSTNANPNVYFGNVSLAAFNGATARGAADVLIWGAQLELGAYATSYIPTTSAALMRSAELASFPVTPASVATGSISTRVQLLTTATNGLVSATASGTFKQAVITFGGERAYVGGVSLVGPLSALTAGQHSAVVWWDGTSTNLVLDGATTSGAAGTPSATNALQVGNYDATTNTDEPGIYSRLCLDPSPTRCR